MKHFNDCTQHHFSESEYVGELICDICGFDEAFILQQRIAALEAAAQRVVETSEQVDHSGIYAYEMDYRRAIQHLAALLPGRGHEN